MFETTLTLILVRHGLTEWNEQGRLLGRTAIELSPAGRAQAAAAAQALRGEKVDALFASPLQRAQETAQAIAAELGLSIETEADLDEVCANRWVGQTWEQLRDNEDIQRYVADPLYECDAFEPAKTVQERIARFIVRRRETHAGKKILLVSHGDPLRILVSHCIGLSLGHYRSLAIGNGSITRLRLYEGGGQLTLLNWQPPAAEL